MLELTIKEAKRNFFDRATVIARVDAARRRNLLRAGASVRKHARYSIKPARRLKLSEMGDEQRERSIYFIDRAKREGRPKPKLPFAPSRPGDPPRSRVGLLRQFIFFAYDDSTRSVVIGPARIGGSGTAPGVLELGGVNDTGGRVAARPYMRPAELDSRALYLELWKDCVS